MLSDNGFIQWLIKYYLPPMIANALPVLVKGVKRIDAGRVFIDGKPLLGENKTWEGLFTGLVASYIAGSSLSVIYSDPQLPLLSTGAGLFALLGDILGAFIKRRIGLKPGEPALFLDQWDFALGSTFFYYITGTAQVYSKPLFILLMLIVVFTLHVGTNLIAYSLGLKHSKL
jgi:CDP-2,3-bis-(O-geranylgeranyl)-sn-glycerol synthase